jgi:membrane protein
MRLTERITAVTTWVEHLKPVRVYTNFLEMRGPVLAGGLAYQALFAVFAALWIGFSIIGIVLDGNVALQEGLVDLIASLVPGLITTDTQQGLLDPEVLLNAGVLTLSALIATVGLVFTALAWLGWARSSIRLIFNLPQLKRFFVLQILVDLGLALLFGLAFMISAVLAVVATAATENVLEFIGVYDSTSATVISRVSTALVMFGFTIVTLGALYRVLSGIKIPWSRLRNGVLFGATALSVLQLLGSVVIGGATVNPLTASFAIVAGVLIFFYFSSQIILGAASWIAVDIADRGIDLNPSTEQLRIEKELEPEDRP